MADVTDLDRVVAEYRQRWLENTGHLRDLAAFDAVTTLLLAAVEELREIRIRGVRKPDS